MNKLYFGDNLTVLREHIAPESVDLIYLDPPFNSKANYNVLFKSGSGQKSEAQAEAFRDTWEWGESAEHAYDLVRAGGGDPSIVLSGLRRWLGENAMMAYLAMMTARLVEMRAVLKPTGSIYLHCDPTASHYLKLVLDAVFGHANFRNEIIWKRTTAHSGAKRFSPVHDVILYYSKSAKHVWNDARTAYAPEYLDKYYRFDDGDGRLYWRDNICAAGTRNGDSGKPWRGFDPASKGMHWKFRVQRLDELDAEGRIYWPAKEGGMPQYKRYREELKGLAISDIWDDVSRINPVGKERLGYPTQKPEALLKRIIEASTNPGNVVLDPFCGCGTSIDAAEALGRRWIGIDVTHYAVTLIERRLKASHPTAQYTVHGRPTDLAGAVDLAHRDKHQFQWWAAWLLGAQRYREEKKGADRGVDGRALFKNGPYGDGLVVISVKGGDNIGVQMVRDLRGVIERDDAEMGVLVTLVDPTRPMIAEAAAGGFVRRSAHGQMPRLQIATVADLLEGRFPRLPPLPKDADGLTRAPKAARRDKRQMELLFSFEGGKQADVREFADPRYVALG